MAGRWTPGARSGTFWPGGRMTRCAVGSRRGFSRMSIRVIAFLIVIGVAVLAFVAWPKKPTQPALPLFGSAKGAPDGEPKEGFLWEETKGIE